MNTRNLGIAVVVLVILAIAAYAIYYFWYKKGERDTGTATGGTGTAGTGTGIFPNVGTAVIHVTPPLGFHSTLVNKSDIVVAQNPSLYFNNLDESNVVSHNVIAPSSNLPAASVHANGIHYVTGFNDQCPAFVWYAHGVYVYAGTKTDDQGNKTCYYKYDKAVFPATIRVKLLPTSASCTTFKYFISGVEYRYKEQTTEHGGLGPPKDIAFTLNNNKLNSILC